MDVKLEMLLNKLETIEDDEAWIAVLDEAIAYAPHHPKVLLAQAISAETAYECLSYLDHGMRHLRVELNQLGAFKESALESFGYDDLSQLYLYMMTLRLQTLLNISYDYQAFADYNELRYLDRNNTVELDEYGITIALRLDNIDMGRAIYDEDKNYTLYFDFPYAVLLHKNNFEEEALSILRPYLEDVPYFRDLVKSFVSGELLDDDLAEKSQDILPAISEYLQYLDYGLMEGLIEEYH